MQRRSVVLEPQLVPAVFSDRASAEDAVAKLRKIGILDGDIGMAVPQPGRHQHREQSDKERFAIVGQSAAAGGALGSVGGMGLLTLATGEALALGVGGLVAAGMGGLVWGGVIAGLIGVITRIRRQPDDDRWCEIQLEGDEVLLVVRVRDWAHEDRVAAALADSGARCVLDQLPLDKDWHDLELEHPSGQPLPVG